MKPQAAPLASRDRLLLVGHVVVAFLIALWFYVPNADGEWAGLAAALAAAFVGAYLIAVGFAAAICRFLVAGALGRSLVSGFGPLLIGAIGIVVMGLR